MANVPHPAHVHSRARSGCIGMIKCQLRHATLLEMKGHTIKILYGSEKVIYKRTTFIRC